jgi:PKD repeat protein
MKLLINLFAVTVVLIVNSCSSDEEPPPAPMPDAVEADFSGDATSIIAGDMVNFSDGSTGNPTSWSWTFEGGTPETSTEENPSVHYIASGTYSVTLTASNANSNDTETKSGYITVEARPTPAEFDIVGTWERVESNNPSLDGMQVTVIQSEEEGEIVSSPSTGAFPVGELKWREIEKISEHEYVIQDRFSDGTFDESSLFILAYGNELIIGNFNAPNLGSFQRWIRIDFRYEEDEDYTLADVWERTKSNNPPLDGMKVEVNADETEAVITETTDPTNFPMGAIKWNSIEKEGANRFVLDDLASDGNLIESRIFIVGKGREVILGGFSTLNGSFQRWTRE